MKALNSVAVADENYKIHSMTDYRDVNSLELRGTWKTNPQYPEDEELGIHTAEKKDGGP